MPEEFFNPKPRLGISACLLGEKVRYDGGDKKDYFLTETFGRHVQWVPVCPEVEIGMGIPREAVRFSPRPCAARRPTDPGRHYVNKYKAYVERIAALELSIPSEVRMDRRTTVGQRE